MRRLKRVLSWAIILPASALGLLMLLTALLSPWLVTNIDDSLPGLFYQIERGTLPARGEVAALRVPANPYYPIDAPFLKIVKGLPGDRVMRIKERVYVNGEYVGIAKPFTRRGNPLTPGPTGVIPPGRYFIWTPHPDSYDSRYGEVGWIKAERFLGTAKRVL